MPEGRELARDVTVWQEAGAGSLHTLAAQVEQLQLSLQLRGAVSLLQPQAAVLSFYLTEIERVKIPPFIAAQVDSCSSASSSVCSSLRL